MISPVGVTTLRGRGLPASAAPVVVADQGSAGFSPRLPMALSQPPSGVIWGWRTPPDLVAVFLPSVFFSSAAVSGMDKGAIARGAINEFFKLVFLFSKNLAGGKELFHTKM